MQREITSVKVVDHVWHVILNTNANEKRCEREWRPVAEAMRRCGIRHDLHRVGKPGEGIEIAKSLCENGIRHIVAAGGDGTVNEVVNGIMLSGANSSEVFMAVLPLGRGNDWVRTHHFPKSIGEVVEMWHEGRFMKHDVGRVTTYDGERPAGSRYFINIAGFGFDADVIYDVTHHPSHFLGFNTYVLSLLKTLFSHKPTPVKVTAGGGFAFAGDVFMVIAAICQYNGGGIREAKYAVPDDGKIDLIVVPAMSVPKVLRHLKDMTSGDHLDKIKEIRKTLTSVADIRSPQLLRGETEGELLIFGDYRVEVFPHAINVLTANC